MNNFLHLTAYAAEKWNSLEGPDKDVATVQSLTMLFKNAVTGITAFAGIVLFVVLIMAGFTFLFSGGDHKQLEKAKHSFTYAIVGILVIACAYLILQLIGMFTGISVTKFNLNIQ